MDSQGISNNAGHTDHQCNAERRAPKRILYGIAGAVALSFIAIAIGLVINNDGTEKKATEVFASWMKFFSGKEEGHENELSDLLPRSQADVRSSKLAYESEDGTYLIRKRYSEENRSYESNGLVCVYSDEAGEHVEPVADGIVTEFSVMDGVLYYTAWDEEASGWTLYQRELTAGAEAGESLSEEYRGKVSVNFSCYGGKIYYIRIGYDLTMFCYDPKNQTNNKVQGIVYGAYIYDIWRDTFYNVDIWEGTLWKKLPGERQRRMELPGMEGLLREVKICPYQDSVYLAVIAGEWDQEWDEDEWADAELCIFTLDGESDEGRNRMAASMELFPFDINENWYYVDGCFYFSSFDHSSVYVYDLGECTDGGDENGSEACELFDADGNIVEFEVTEHFIYTHLYEERHLIRVYDRLTGELLYELLDGQEEICTNAG